MAAAGIVSTPLLAQLAQQRSAPLGTCGDDIKTAMQVNADTQVVLVKAFQRGDRLVVTNDPGTTASQQNTVEGAAKVPPPVADTDLCMVKLLVGPGHPGPAGAPSTSAGIGIEVLLPTPQAWNERIRVYGNSGWSGTPQASPTVVASDDIHSAAVATGFVVATSDNGHVANPVDASFGMNPDGSINTVLMNDFTERGLHVLAETTKALTRAFYGRAQRYAYFDGFSNGGHQALKFAQRYPDDFNGVLVGAPAINWTTFLLGGLYGPIAMQQDLGQVIAPEKLAAISRAALKGCSGTKLGFMLDPYACRYDPEKDPAILCASGITRGGDVTAAGTGTCLTPAEAKVVNKIWYGQTRDGSVPSPARDNGSNNRLDGKTRIWFGLSRGTELEATSAGGAPAITLGAGQAALALQDASLGDNSFRNATGNGMDSWREKLDYAGLANAQAMAVALQPQFSDINTDNPDLSAFAAAGGKAVMYHGTADEYIPMQGSVNYYLRVADRMGGIPAVQRFYRFYVVPGFTHSGRQEGKPFVPVPQPATGRDEMFTALQNWVELAQTPRTTTVTSSNGQVSMPLCVFPQKVRYRGTGSVKAAASYTCS